MSLVNELQNLFSQVGQLKIWNCDKPGKIRKNNILFKVAFITARVVLHLRSIGCSAQAWNRRKWQSMCNHRGHGSIIRLCRNCFFPNYDNFQVASMLAADLEFIIFWLLISSLSYFWKSITRPHCRLSMTQRLRRNCFIQKAASMQWLGGNCFFQIVINSKWPACWLLLEFIISLKKQHEATLCDGTGGSLHCWVLYIFPWRPCRNCFFQVTIISKWPACWLLLEFILILKKQHAATLSWTR